MMKPTLAPDLEPMKEDKEGNDMYYLDSQRGDIRLYRGMG